MGVKAKKTCFGQSTSYEISHHDREETICLFRSQRLIKTFILFSTCKLF